MTICRRPLCAAISLAASLVVQHALAAAACESLEPCAARACRLDAQIARARDQGQASQAARLERQRADLVHCSDDGLKQKRKMALERAQSRIDRRETELAKAMASGDAAKIKKAQRNLDSARKAYAGIETSPL
jgi:hypothetical protein